MSAAEALQAAWVAGVEVTVNAKDLSLEATSRPPEFVLTDLFRNKTGIVALLGGWKDWQVYFDERVAEFDGDQACAFKGCINEWLFQNPPAPHRTVGTPVHSVVMQ